MYKIEIKFPSGKTIYAQSGVRATEFLEEFEVKKEDIFAVRINNEVCPLNKPIVFDSEIEPVMNGTKEAGQVYRRTLSFLLTAAFHNIAPKKQVVIEHSINHAYYYTIKNGEAISEKTLLRLKEEMHRMVEHNIPIETKYVSYNKAAQIMDALGLEETRKAMKYNCPPSIQMNVVGDYMNLYYGALLISTGQLKVFDLIKYENGFLLQFPKSENPDTLEEFTNIPILFKTYERYKKWGRQIGVTTIAALNEMANNREANRFINITEVFQERCLADIATQIQNRKKVRLVLIAGPSSSGKTTSAKKLALQLEAIGYDPKVLSLDNYYVGRDVNPRDENGNYDYECLEALDIELINQNLIDLLAGKVVDMPSYNFNSGMREYKGDTMQLKGNDILIMEGIHGLNDKLTPLVKSENKFKIYLSALTQLNMNEHNRISSSDNRLIRRIVRDNNFRAKSAADTIAMWDSVQRGERKHIFPFQNNADAILNTALDYELSVLRIYAEPLLRCISPDQREYSEACRLLRFLQAFPTIPAEAVPPQSIIREFIGGSAFKY